MKNLAKIKDPYGTNCYSDHVTVRTIPVQAKEESGTLTLVYSPKCRSNWVKWEGETGAKNRLTVWREGSPGDPVTTAHRFDGDNSGQNTWSNMISAKGDTCVKIKFLQSGQESEDTCTDGLDRMRLLTKSKMGSYYFAALGAL